MLEYVSTRVLGFSDIGTGVRDYGKGIIRISSTSPLGSTLLSEPNRHLLVRVETRAHDRVLAIARPTPNLTANEVALEYHDRLRLSVEKGAQVEISIVAARRIETFGYLWSHPDSIIRYQFRLSVYLTSIALLVGSLLSVALAL